MNNNNNKKTVPVIVIGFDWFQQTVTFDQMHIHF